MSKRLLAIVAMAAFFVVVAVGVAGAVPPTIPYEENAECIECHTVLGTAHSDVDFVDAAPSVDKATACPKCHWEPAASHPFHMATWNCGSCHPMWGATNMAAVPKVEAVPGVWFNSAASYNADVDTIHSVHSNPRWPSTALKNGRQCSTCHLPAACNVCHTGVDPTTHEDHSWNGSAYTYPPSSVVFGLGTSAPGVETELRTITGLTCSNATCHDTSAGGATPVLVEDTNASVSYSVAPSAWGRSSTAGYSGNTYKISNAAGAWAQYTFTGRKISFITDKGPYRGYVRVLIDGGEVLYTSLYAAALEKQVVIYTSPVLTEGSHTIRIEVPRVKEAAARDYYVVLDAFRMYPDVAVSRTPCITCHSPAGTDPWGVDRKQNHGADPLLHTVTAASSYCTAAGCHSAWTEIASAHAARGVGCVGCHENAVLNTVPWTFIASIDTPECEECHNNALADLGTKTNNPFDYHVSHGGRHALDLVGSNYNNTTVTGCTGAGNGCHAGATTNIVDYHTDKTSCLTGNCHTSANNEGFAVNEPYLCTDCHSGSYANALDVVQLTEATPAGHYGEAIHSAVGMANTVNGFAGGTATAACSACHNPTNAGGLDNLWYQHQDLPGNNDVTCSDCHNYNAGVTGEITGNWTTDACGDCHNGTDLPAMAQHASTAPAVNGTTPLGTCTGAGCHASMNLHYLHRGDGTGPEPTCDEAGCHDYTKQGLKPTATTCGAGGACHTGITSLPHGNHNLDLAGSNYNNTTVAGCTSAGAGCHPGATTDIIDYHTDQTSCYAGACHTSANNPGFAVNEPYQCMDCHSGGYANAADTVQLYEATPAGHYGQAIHTAVGMSNTMNGYAGGLATAACSSCHNPTNAGGIDNLWYQHQDVPGANADVTCQECHSYSAQLAAEIKTNNWSTDACTDCHKSGAGYVAVQHDGTTAPVVNGTSSLGACAQAGCHLNMNLHYLHRGNGGASDPTCDEVGCHDYTVQAVKPTTTTCGTGNACHTDKTLDNHGTRHQLDLAGSNYNNTTVAGCTNASAGCHGVGQTSTDIVDYHTDQTSCLTGACHTSANNEGFAVNEPYLCIDCHGGSYANAFDRDPLFEAAPTGHYKTPFHLAVGLSDTMVGFAGGPTTAACTDCHNPTNAGGIDNLWYQHQDLPGNVDMTCVDCHGYSPEISLEVKVSYWTNDLCTDCHSGLAGFVAVQHDGSTAPVVNGSSSLGDCSSCHTSNNLHYLHRGNGAAPEPACNVAGCHDYTKQGLKPTLTTCGTGNDCHIDKTMTNHAHPLDTALSAYDNVAIDGCTGAGAGCHGATTPASYANTQYHPIAGAACLTGNCHNAGATNHNDPAFDGTISCQECHGGGTVDYIPAALVSNLLATTGASEGHYDTALHTATGMGNTLNAGGTASAACTDCHSTTGSPLNQLYAQHQNIGAAAPVVGPGFSDDFASGSFVAGGWTADYQAAGGGTVLNQNFDSTGGTWPAAYPRSSATRVTLTNVAAYREGTWGAQIHQATGGTTRTDYFDITFTVTAPNTTITYRSYTVGLANPDYSRVSYSTGTTYVDAGATNIEASNATNHAWSNSPASPVLPIGDVTVRFWGSYNQATEYICYDTIVVSAPVVAEDGWSVVTNQARAIGGDATTRVLKKTGIDNSGAASINFTYDLQISGFEAGDSLVVQYSPDGSAWTTQDTWTANQALTPVSRTLPVGTTAIQFVSTQNAADDLAYVDNVDVTPVGTPGAGTDYTCSDCHNYNAGVTAEITGNWTNNTCDDCHNATDMPGFAAQHMASIPVIAATTVDGCGGCHTITNIHTLHQGDGVATDPSCDATGCHDFAAQATKPASTSCGASGACHTGPHPEIPHPADMVNGTVDGSVTYTYGKNDGCFSSTANVGCHFQDLRLEHGTTQYLIDAGITNPAPVQRAFDGTIGGSTKGCSICHTTQGAPGQYAARTAIQSALTNGDKRCVACHFETSDAAGTTGVAAPHKTYIAGAQGTTYEWETNGALVTSGGHNAFGVNYPKTSGFGTVNTVAVTGTWPFVGSLQTGWTTSSPVNCVDCHFKTAAPNGPQGAAVPYYLNNGTAVSNWAHTVLVDETSVPALCATCHSALSSGIHGRGAHDTGMQCRNCHIEIPHAWRRPRLLRRSHGDTGTLGGTSGGVAADVAPYLDTAADTAAGWIMGVNVTANPTPAAGNCVATGCAEHATASRMWP